MDFFSGELLSFLYIEFLKWSSACFVPKSGFNAVWLRIHVMISGLSGSELGEQLREQLDTNAIAGALEQLQRCPVGLDKVLRCTVAFGVAFHHAGKICVQQYGLSPTHRCKLVATPSLSKRNFLPPEHFSWKYWLIVAFRSKARTSEFQEKCWYEFSIQMVRKQHLILQVIVWWHHLKNNIFHGN